MFERFTDGARRAVVVAQEEARLRRHDYIGTEHILLGLLGVEESPGVKALKAAGISPGEVGEQVSRSLPPGTVPPTGHIPFTSRAKKVLELALRESLQFGHNYIGTEHLLLGLMREDEGLAAQALRASGADLDGLRNHVRAVLDPAASPQPNPQRAGDSFRFERYTGAARRAVVEAQEAARGLNHNYIGTEHLLLGLLGVDGAPRDVLQRLGMARDTCRERVVEIIGLGETSPTGHIPFTPRVRKVLELSLREALMLGHDHLGPEHLLLGLVREAEGVAAQILTLSLGDAALHQVREETVRALAAPPPEPEPAEPPEHPGLRDLTRAARESRLVPVAGREREIQRVMQILMRKSRNNPLLVGEPGIGRTAIVMGLAQRIARGEAPAGLAGVRMHAVHPERLRTVLEGLRDPGDTVLFLDDLDLGDGPDVLSALREAPTRVIAVTSPEAYHPALDAFFQRVPVGEPSHADTVAILTLLRPEYESHHGVSITDDALEAAATLATRHITDRVLPGKAIEILDEAGARVRMTDGAQTVDAAVIAGLFAEGAESDDDRYVWAMS